MRVNSDPSIQQYAYGQNRHRGQSRAENSENRNLPEPRIISGEWSESDDSMFVYSKTHMSRGVYEPTQVERTHLHTSRAMRAVSVYGHDGGSVSVNSASRPGKYIDEYA